MIVQQRAPHKALLEQAGLRLTKCLREVNVLLIDAEDHS